MSMLAKARASLVGTSLLVPVFGLYPMGTVVAQEDAVEFANRVVEAGQQSKMSRSPLDEGGVVWTGAETSPKTRGRDIGGRNAVPARSQCLPVSVRVGERGSRGHWLGSFPYRQ